jgi:1-acyl-sn-glycerol-3-phosphate acyltransferase
MIYRLLRWVAGIALHWFYRDIRIVGDEKIPGRGPLLIAVNHQNALVDSLIAGWIMPRPITMTAKATLVDNPFVAALFRMVGVVPLRRVSDEVRKASGAAHDASRNSSAFREILMTLSKRGAVLIFPEGKSHNETGLEPLRSGLARLALQARDEQKIVGLRILPVGLVFEDKATPGSGVDVQVADTIEMDTWNGNDPSALTAEIAKRLRSVSEKAVSPVTPPEPSKERLPKRALVTVAAAWGRLTHELPIRLARRLALRQSTDADQPAMLTMIFGIGLVLLTYVLQIAVVGTLVRSFWISSLYLASLLVGAYWAAFEKHPQHY